MTLRAYAERKGWDLASSTVAVNYEAPGRCEPARYTIAFEFDPHLSAGHQTRLRAIAGKCPVRRSLASPAQFDEITRTLAEVPA
jgi:uncharacterized OsmC-like protein